MKFLKEAIKEAEKSKLHFKIGVIIFKGNVILSRGYNKISHNRKLHPKFMKWLGSIHAEQDAILNANTSLKGASILVIRINNIYNLKNSKPCRYCMKYLQYVGIKKIYYSDKDGDIVMMKL